MSGGPAASVHEVLNSDERLVQLHLEAQAHLVQHKGAPAVPYIPNATLVAALVHSAAFRVQQQQLQQQQQQQQRGSSTTGQGTTAAVLALLLPEWHKLLLQRLHAAQMLLPDVPLVSAVRNDAEQQHCQQPRSSAGPLWWQEVGSGAAHHCANNPDLPCAKLVYAAGDLLEALTRPVTVQGSGQIGDQQQRPGQLTLLQAVHVPSRTWLQAFFADLQPDRRQVGLDDVLHPFFREQQVQQAFKAAASCSAAACREAARTGVPASQRPWVWATALGLHAMPPDLRGGPGPGSGSGSGCSPAAAGVSCSLQGPCWQLPSARDDQVLRLLCEAVDRQTLLVDALMCADVQQLADSAHFFVFEQAMRAMLLAFSRDASIAQSAAVPPTPLVVEAAAKGGRQEPRPYPPSGVLPFSGLALFLGPLCYLYSSPAAMYPVFRELYCRYWCRLHTLDTSTAPQAGLAVLCRTFLDLLQEIDPEVCAALGRLSPSPLDLAFPWIMSAFATHLSPAETLLLWDRVIGFDSLLPLPVLAVAVVTFRRDLVLAAETGEELAELLQDLGQIRVVPLLQALLFDT